MPLPLHRGIFSLSMSANGMVRPCSGPDERAPPHSITSSARCRNDSGFSGPAPFAALKCLDARVTGAGCTPIDKQEVQGLMLAIGCWPGPNRSTHCEPIRIEAG
jgi:hypothetical protein